MKREKKRREMKRDEGRRRDMKRDEERERERRRSRGRKQAEAKKQTTAPDNNFRRADKAVQRVGVCDVDLVHRDAGAARFEFHPLLYQVGACTFLWLLLFMLLLRGT